MGQYARDISIFLIKIPQLNSVLTVYLTGNKTIVVGGFFCEEILKELLIKLNVLYLFEFSFLFSSLVVCLQPI